MSVSQYLTSSTETRVLIANDDGIDAAGLQALAEGLSRVPSFDVRVGAPDSERSGSSHALRGNIGATYFPKGTKEGLPQTVSAFSTSGYPADAVRLPFLTNIFGDNWIPDLVVSGINRGGNGGKYIMMSGTVAAAREGVIQGVKAIAVSLHLKASGGREKEDYAHGVELVVPIIKWFLQEDKWPKSVLLSINIPFNGRLTSTPNGVFPIGMLAVPQGDSSLSCYIDPNVTSNGFTGEKDGHTNHYRVRYKYKLDPMGTIETDEVVAMEEGYLTLTPMAAHGTGEDVKEALNVLRQWHGIYKHPVLDWKV